MASTTQIREENRHRLAEELLNHPGSTQLELQQKLGLSDLTVLKLLKELRQAGYVESAPLPRTGAGRPPVGWSLRAEAKYAIGVQLQRYRLLLVAVDLQERVAASSSVELAFLQNRTDEELQTYLRGDRLENEKGPDFVTGMREALLEQIPKFMQNIGIGPDAVIGIGIAAAGSISDGFWHFVHYKLELSAEEAFLQEKLGAPVHYYRDDQQVGIAEMRAAGLSSAVCLVMDYGLGGTAIENSVLWNGGTGRGTTFGHMLLHPGGKRCICGKRGCLSCYCSGWSLISDSFPTIESFMQSLERQAPAAVSRWNQLLSDLAEALCSFAALFDEPIILSGLLASRLEQDLPSLRALCAEKCGMDYPVTVLTGHYRENAAAVGAALQWHRHFLTSQI